MPNYDPEQPTDVRTDGRNLRSQRTASSIAAAYLELLEHGELRPTVRDVAAAAGVSERAVFRHFEDTESLFNSVAKMQITEVIAGLPQLVGASDPLVDRIDSYLDRWCGVFERVTPVRRAANINEPFSPTIQRRRAWAEKRRAIDFETLFANELSGMSSSEQRDARDAAAALLSWYTWESLRTQQRLSVIRARKLMNRTLQTIVDGTL